MQQIQPKPPTAGSATSPLVRFARCARVIPRSRSACGLAHLGKGVLRPPLHPPGPRAPPLRNPPPLRGVDARLAPGPGLAPWPVPHAPCRPAGLACRSRAHLFAVRAGGSSLIRWAGQAARTRGRCSRRGLDALRQGETRRGRKPFVNSICSSMHFSQGRSYGATERQRKTATDRHRYDAHQSRGGGRHTPDRSKAGRVGQLHYAKRLSSAAAPAPRGLTWKPSRGCGPPWDC